MEQVFQKVKGVLRFADMRTRVRNPRLEGSKIQFSLTDANGTVRHFDGAIKGARMEGTISGPAGNTHFIAERQGQAPPIGGSTPASIDELNNLNWSSGE